MRVHRLRLDGSVYWAVARDAERARLWSDAPWSGGRETTREVPLDAATYAAPVSPGKIVCVGRNYAAHARELGHDIPAEPLLFLKPPSALLDPGRLVELPPESSQVEHEGEVAIVVGRQLRRAGRQEALEAIAGITCADDVTARDLQRKDIQFTRAKGFDTFCPVGAWVETQPGPLERLELVTRVNGETRQHGRVGDMLWPVEALLAYISNVMTLDPGDLILTGTPAGVGPLAAGDTVEVEIPGIAVLRHGVRKAITGTA